jgi:hypothetical protein
MIRQHATTMFSAVGMMPRMNGTSRLKFRWSTTSMISRWTAALRWPRSMT